MIDSIPCLPASSASLALHFLFCLSLGLVAVSLGFYVFLVLDHLMILSLFDFCMGMVLYVLLLFHSTPRHRLIKLSQITLNDFYS